MNYRIPTRAALRATFEVELAHHGEGRSNDVDDARERDVWPGGMAPMIRAGHGTAARTAEMAVFGLIPPWAKDRKHARRCYNGRTETIAEKPSFRAAWRGAHFALIPMVRFYEPNWESGKAQRWSIAMRDGSAFAAGAIWSYWRDPVSGEGVPSFSLLTLNADEHPVLGRFHGPEDEKRSIFLVPEPEWDTWLRADPELARVMLTLPDPEGLEIAPALLPPRGKKQDAHA